MNETMDIAGFEQRVRERAYALWENEGRPHGRHVAHWLASEAAVRAELAPEAVVAALEVELTPAPVAPKAEPAPAPAKPAAKPKTAAAKTAKPKAAEPKAAAPKAAAPRKRKAAVVKPIESYHAISTTLQ
jgi:hypothetical protein